MINEELLNEQNIKLFENLYDILILRGANIDERDSFIRTFTKPGEYTPHEWRFCGIFGLGGKFRYTESIFDLKKNKCPFYVDYYPEDRTNELDRRLNNMNLEIKECFAKWFVRQIVIDLVTEKQGCKVMDIVAEYTGKVYSFFDKDPGYDISTVVDDLAREGELVRIEYTLPNLSYKTKEILLPANTTVVVTGNGRRINK